MTTVKSITWHDKMLAGIKTVPQALIWIECTWRSKHGAMRMLLMQDDGKDKQNGYAKAALVAFAKNPDAVPVKTRLAQSLGTDLSRRLYIAMLEDCLSSLQSIDGACLYLACYPDDNAVFFTRLSRKYNIKLLRQEGEDLGERMLTCIKTLLNLHSAVMVFGTDVPLLPVDSIVQVLNTDWDVILGPSRDGGYYALGAKRVDDLMFEGVNWGTETVFSKTMKNCAGLGLEVALLAACDDIDDEESLHRLCDMLKGKEQGAEATYAILKESGLLLTRA